MRLFREFRSIAQFSKEVDLVCRFVCKKVRIAFYVVSVLSLYALNDDIACHECNWGHVLERRPDLCNQHHHHLEMAPRWAKNPMLDWRHTQTTFLQSTSLLSTTLQIIQCWKIISKWLDGVFSILIFTHLDYKTWLACCKIPKANI